jgi:hypothetical protein
MGWKTDEDRVYATLVEKLLNEASAKTRYEVLNLGLCGLNTRLNVNRLTRIGLRYRPDLVVYGFTTNDIETPQEFGMRESGEPNPLLAEWRRFADSRSRLLQIVWPRWVSVRYNIFHQPAPTATASTAGTSTSPTSGSAWPTASTAWRRSGGRAGSASTC